MKKYFWTMALALSLCLSLCVNASAASYVPDDTTYQNLNGQQQAVKVFTLLADQDPSDLIEPDFEYNGYMYSYSGMTKKEQTYSEETLHTETVTVTTDSKDLAKILAELKPTIEYDDGNASGTLALDHESLKTEAAGYKSSSYTVTATKNYTGLDRNDSSYIDKTVTKNGRTLSLSNITWTVESTALVGDELVPATYAAVATYSGTASSTVATGYITTAEYTGKISASGVASIQYTVTYIGTPIVVEEPPEEPEPTGVPIPALLGSGILCAALAAGLLLFFLMSRKNITVYGTEGPDDEYEKCGRLHLSVRNPELRIDKLKDVPSGIIAFEVAERTAKKLINRRITIRYYDRRFGHKVGEVNGAYWFKLDVGSNPDCFEENEEDTVV